MKLDLNPYLELNKKIIREVGNMLRESQSADFQIQYKSPRDLVTKFDRESQKFIITSLQEKFPHHSFTAEEESDDNYRGTTTQKNHQKFRWIIDPIDGTTNFAHGHPFFCISIGLEIEGELQVGAVYAPILDELFYAAKGHGAFLETNNGSHQKKIHVSTMSTLRESLVATGFNPSNPEKTHSNIKNYEYFTLKTHGVRRCGAAALDLCYVAAGRTDGFWEYGLKAWDTAAGAVILQEAGGRITQLNGSPFTLESPTILASNKHIHDEMLAYFQKAATS